MATRMLTKGERTQRRIAASYRKQGYRVVVPTAADAPPAFLHDCRPDLIAERDDDRVVVEIKRAGSLKGANDLVELAQRVERQPGWRLELVTYKDRDPDATLISSQGLHQILAPGTDALTCIYRLEVVGLLLRGIASRAAAILILTNLPGGRRRQFVIAGSEATKQSRKFRGLGSRLPRRCAPRNDRGTRLPASRVKMRTAARAGKTLRNKTATAIANELAFEGLIDGSVSDRIDDSYRWKTHLMRGNVPSPPAAIRATELETLCRALFAHAQQT